jgi:hypothetical protein
MINTAEPQFIVFVRGPEKNNRCRAYIKQQLLRDHRNSMMDPANSYIWE